MKVVISKIFLLFAFLLLLSECTLQHRLYRKGYYVEEISYLKRKRNVKINHNIRDEGLTIKSAYLSKSEKEDDAIVATSKKDYLPKKASDKKLRLEDISNHIKYVLPDDSCGDKIILKTGDEFIVKIIEVSDKEIKYKKCDNPEGPLYTISSSKVYVIEYANGVKEHVISEESERKESNTTKNKSVGVKEQYPASYWLAWVLFGLGIITTFFGGVILLPFASVAARKARRELYQTDKHRARFEMGIIMYYIIGLCTLIMLLLWGGAIVMFAMAPSSSGFGGPALVVMLGIAFLILSLPLFLFVRWFYKSSRPEEL
ncbi:MAG: YjgN family protein [Bacteroidia bacterium]|nr:YjgN family protein [Bacteroidia bacterium]